MGSQGGFIGRIGNVIHYKMGDKDYTRSVPKKYKQTKGTKAKSIEHVLQLAITVLKK